MKPDAKTCLASLVLTTVALVAGGCAHEATARERAESFESLRDVRVGSATLKDYLAARTWSVLAGKGVSVRERPDGAREIILTSKVDFGSATAVSRDGYLLTAAHCVADRPLVVTLWGGNRYFAAEPRLVWVGKRGTAYQDLALLKVDVTEPTVPYFDWAGDQEMRAGSSVAIAGLRPGDALLGVTYAGGILRSSRFGQSADAAVPITYVSFDAPGGHGDSGGPVTTPAGHLVGITVGLADVEGRAARMPVAARPNLVWLRQLMESDRARRVQ